MVGVTPKEPLTMVWDTPAWWEKTRIDASKIKVLYLDCGMTTKAVAEALKISKSSVIQHLHSFGIRRVAKKLTQYGPYFENSPF